MKLYAKASHQYAADMSGTIELSPEELLEKLKKGETLKIQAACDDIRYRGGHCPRGNHRGTIEIRLSDK